MPYCKKPPLTLLILFLFFISTLFVANIMFPRYAVTAENQEDSKIAELAWVKRNGENYDIGYSYFDGDNWKGQLVLSNGNPVNFVPAIAKKNNGETWLVWSSDTGNQYHLYYAVVHDDNEFQGPFQFLTGMSSNATPSIIIDNASIPWIVWSGNKGDDDDIYFSKFIGNKWQQPKAVHIDNENPDIFPKLILESNGAVVVEWTNLSKIKSQQQRAYLQQGEKDAKSLRFHSPLTTKIKDRIFNCATTLPEVENLDLSTLQLNCEEDPMAVQFVGKVLKQD